MKTVIILNFLLCVTLTTKVLADSCLEYEPATVSLSGIVVRETHPGPPNYVDVSKGDRPETIWVLILEDKICVNRKDDLINRYISDVLEVQLVLKPEQYNQYKHLIGEKVSISGTLFHSHTGHHYKELLLTINEIKKNA